MTNALREAHRVLRPGGTLYVAEPLPTGNGHEVVSLIDDETEVRGFAQDALARLVSPSTLAGTRSSARQIASPSWSGARDRRRGELHSSTSWREATGFVTEGAKDELRDVPLEHVPVGSIFSRQDVLHAFETPQHPFDEIAVRIGAPRRAAAFSRSQTVDSGFTS